MNETKFADLTIKNAFMFSAVMADEEICRKVIELALGIPISKVHVYTEKTMAYHPEYHGIRLDVYADDANHTRFNIEMQVVYQKFLPKRSRYYHSQLDMDALLTGESYENLPATYVIFICDFDPYGLGLYRYTCGTTCKESNFDIDDGVNTIYLNTRGKNDHEVPEELVKFLQYVKASKEESEQDFQNDFVRNLQDKIQRIKSDRTMEARYMLFEEMLQIERRAGLQEGREEGRQEGLREGRQVGLQEGRQVGLQEGRQVGLQEGRQVGLQEGQRKGELLTKDAILLFLGTKGSVSQELSQKIMSQPDFSKLEEWLRLSAQVSSVSEFESKM